MTDQYNKIVLLDKLCSNSLTSFSLFDFGDSPGLESRIKAQSEISGTLKP